MNEDWKDALNKRAETVQASSAPARKKPRDIEHRIQAACVQWLSYRYPKEGKCLFAIPNGGRRDKATGAKLKEEGVKAGVADLFLCVPSGDKHGLFIEMKTGEHGSRQSVPQKVFAAMVQEQGYSYEVCRSFEEFTKAVIVYLGY